MTVETDTIKEAITTFYEVLLRRSEEERMDDETTGHMIATAADTLIYNLILDLLDPKDTETAMQALAIHASNVGKMLRGRYPRLEEPAPPTTSGTVH